ncbi:MAG: response regulator transcription factor [Actinomycetota bacterium]|nr:response regulator transcription factor [Actinomycetota bacterium]
MNGGPRVLLADDHVPTRAGLRLVLEEQGFEVCAEEGDAATAVRAASRERPDLCLLDIHMPGSGIEAASAIRFQLPETKIVMLTSSREDGDLFDAVKAGASGYLLKDIDPDRLAPELNAVLDGEAALPRGLVLRLLDEFRSRDRRAWVQLARRRDVELTSREWEVLELMREGLTTGDIAKRLFISTTTVRRHVGAVLKKLQVPDRKAAVRLLEERTSRG